MSSPQKGKKVNPPNKGGTQPAVGSSRPAGRRSNRGRRRGRGRRRRAGSRVNQPGMKVSYDRVPVALGVSVMNDSPTSNIRHMGAVNSAEYGYGEVVSFTQLLCNVGSARNSVSVTNLAPFLLAPPLAVSGLTGLSVDGVRAASGLYINPYVLGYRLGTISNTFGLYRFRNLRVQYHPQTSTFNSNGLTMGLSGDPYLWPETNQSGGIQLSSTDVLQVVPSGECAIWDRKLNISMKYTGDRCWEIFPTQAITGADAADIRKNYQYRLCGTLAADVGDDVTFTFFGRIFVSGIVEFFSPTPGFGGSGFTSVLPSDALASNAARKAAIIKSYERFKKYNEEKKDPDPVVVINQNNLPHLSSQGFGSERCPTPVGSSVKDLSLKSSRYVLVEKTS